MKNLITKLTKIQSDLKAPKGQYNTFAKFHYRSCEDILEGLKPLLRDAGLVLLINDEVILIGERYYVKSTVTLTDGVESVTNTGLAREEDSKKGMDGSQITGASSSYARKYALNGMFAIDDTADSDKTNNSAKETKKDSKPINVVENDSTTNDNVTIVAFSQDQKAKTFGFAESNKKPGTFWKRMNFNEYLNIEFGFDTQYKEV